MAQGLDNGVGKFDGQGGLQNHHGHTWAHMLTGHLQSIGGVGINDLAKPAVGVLNGVQAISMGAAATGKAMLGGGRWE
jgi:hypothetical protein